MEDNPQGLELFIVRQNRKRHLAAIWADLVNLQPGMTIADIGCGPGILTLEYARIVGPTGIVYGVERSPAAAEKLRELKTAIQVLTQEYHTEFYFNAAPDVIFLTDTLHHTPDPAAVLQSVYNACTPQTRVLITEYDPQQPGLVGARPHRRLPRTQLITLAETAGFTHTGAIDTADEHYALIAARR